ncbi:MAG: hypothetical protein R2694_15615 [Ilumatobacteraceae bacterium]
MTEPADHPATSPGDATLTMQYTVEELAVVASYFDLEALPGVREVPLTAAARSQAARTLLARHILHADGAQVAILPPHARLLAATVQNNGSAQVDMETASGWWRTTLFQLDDGTVLVEEPGSEGIVVVSVHPGTWRDVVNASLGLEAADGAAAHPLITTVVITNVSRVGDDAEVTQERYEPAAGAWRAVAATG